MIIGYGLTTKGEAGKYMNETLMQLGNLCDQVIILCNNAGPEEIKMVESRGFRAVHDNREWGKEQWRIKQDFLETFVSKVAKDGDIMVCLDMDETFYGLTKEWLMSAPLDAYHVYVVDQWNDRSHYKPESCFWNVRIWRWNGDTVFKNKPVHCGLAPEWCYRYHRFAPFLLLHKGLMEKEDRARRVARYEKYDPDAVHMDRKYYEMLKSEKAVPLDLEKLLKTVTDEVATYKQTKPTQNLKKPTTRFAYVRNPGGKLVDIDEKHLAETLRKPGFKFIEWVI